VESVAVVGGMVISVVVSVGRRDGGGVDMTRQGTDVAEGHEYQEPDEERIEIAR
jgi:hypothetical protein